MIVMVAVIIWAENGRELLATTVVDLAQKILLAPVSAPTLLHRN